MTSDKEPKIKECEYWIVNSKEEKEFISKQTGYYWPEIGLKFPHIVGREPAFSFQEQKTDPINDYFVKDENAIYRYVKQNITK